MNISDLDDIAPSETPQAEPGEMFADAPVKRRPYLISTIKIEIPCPEDVEAQAEAAKGARREFEAAIAAIPGGARVKFSPFVVRRLK